jgi:hypothetical protein
VGIHFNFASKHARDLTDISEDISYQQKAVTPDQLKRHAGMPTWLNNSFRLRFEHTGDVADISNDLGTFIIRRQ